MEAVAGPGLSEVDRVTVVDGGDDTPADARWILRGATGHERYVERAEREALAARQEGLGRPSATRAALIPIRKSDAWWDLARDERRAIFEARARQRREERQIEDTKVRAEGVDLDVAGMPFDALLRCRAIVGIQIAPSLQLLGIVIAESGGREEQQGHGSEALHIPTTNVTALRF